MIKIVACGCHLIVAGWRRQTIWNALGDSFHDFTTLFIDFRLFVVDRLAISVEAEILVGVFDETEEEIAAIHFFLEDAEVWVELFLLERKKIFEFINWIEKVYDFIMTHHECFLNIELGSKPRKLWYSWLVWGILGFIDFSDIYELG